MIDIGVNFSSAQLQKRIPELLSQASAAGVTHILATGTSVQGSHAAHAVAAAHAAVWFTAGIHPHRAADWTTTTAQALTELLRSPRACAVGECGLDYYRMLAPREKQLRAFEAQLELARILHKPVFLHCRGAHEDFVAVLKGFSDLRGVVHCFTDGLQQAEACLELGLDLGVTGWVGDMGRGTLLREAVPHIPLDRLHLETDSPYLAPLNRPKSQRRDVNTPAYLPWVARAVAGLRSEPLQVVAQATSDNSRRLFGLPCAPSVRQG